MIEYLIKNKNQKKLIAVSFEGLAGYEKFEVIELQNGLVAFERFKNNSCLLILSDNGKIYNDRIANWLPLYGFTGTERLLNQGGEPIYSNWLCRFIDKPQ